LDYQEHNIHNYIGLIVQQVLSYVAYDPHYSPRQKTSIFYYTINS